MTTFRLILTGLLLLGLTGCSRSFWDRSPRVGGHIQPAPYAQAPGARAWTSPAPTPPVQPPVERPPTQLRAMPDGVTTACGPTTEEQQILQEVNCIRTQRGLRPFTWSPLLYRAAREHSREQQEHGYMGHGSPDPDRRTLLQRMQLVAYPGVMYGEVVAWGYRDARAVVEGWMNSPEHRAILIDGDLSEAGFARVGQYWTGNFGAVRAVSSPAPCPVPSRSARASRRAPSYTTPPATRAPQPSRGSTSYATPTPRTAPRPAPRVQDYFRQPEVQPPPGPVFRPPTRGG